MPISVGFKMLSTNSIGEVVFSSHFMNLFFFLASLHILCDLQLPDTSGAGYLSARQSFIYVL
jgi:hypothetical protein